MEHTKRLQIDLKQIKSLLAELRKAKLKCLELSDHLNKDLPKLQKYQILQVRCTRTTQSLDKQGLIKLRNQLTESLAQLYEEERGLMYEVEKNSFKKVVKPPTFRRHKDYYSKQEIGPFKVPMYYNRPEPSINKIQRVTNYIQSIGKSMDSLRKSMQSQTQWDPQDFLKYEPDYLQLLRKIQQFKMRDQQLVNFLQKKVEEEKNRLINQGIKAGQEGDFIIMKVPKSKIDNYGKPQPEAAKETKFSRNANDSTYHPQSMIEPKRKASVKKPKLQKINQEGNNEPNKNEAPENQALDLQIMSFDKKNSGTKSRVSKLDNSNLDQDQNGNFVYVVRKVSPDSQLNSSILSSISSLRSLRKKVFDDDIWDQFEKF